MAGEGLFFTGVVLKNNRDLLKEQEARERLAMDKEKLAMQKEELAAKRKEARKKNYKGLYEDFGESNAGELDFWIKNNVEDHINWVGNNHENEDQGAYHSTKAKQSNNINSGQDVLSDIWSDYSSKIKVLEAGGDAVDKANYVQGEDGVYEFQRRFQDLKSRLGKEGENGITPQQFADAYYDNTDNSLISQTEKFNNHSEWIRNNMKKSTFGDEQFTYYGIPQNERDGAIAEWSDVYTPNSSTGLWDAGKEAKSDYFDKDLFDLETEENINAQVLFLRNKNGGTPEGVQLAALNPNGTYTDEEGVEHQGEYDAKLAREYAEFLAKESLVFPETTSKPASKTDPLKKLKEKTATNNDWLEMQESQDFTEETYGDHGKMLNGYNFTGTSSEHVMQSSMFNNMQVSDRTVNANGQVLSTDTAKKYIENQLGMGDMKGKLSQIAIADDHKNMYGLYTITVSNDATGGLGSMDIEVSIPLDNIDSKLIGDRAKLWEKSIKYQDDLYGTEEKTNSTNDFG